MVKSILRYPGGKSRAVKIILPLLENYEHLYSPFFGGGSIELAFASLNKEKKVYGCDLYKPVANFWSSVIDNPLTVAKIVEKNYPLNKETFKELQNNLPHLEDSIEMAGIFYVLNRASFSGSTNSGGMSPKHPRFNVNSIERLKNFKCGDVEVKHQDAFEFLESLEKKIPDGKIIYLDPPYHIKDFLYGDNGSMHKGFNHKKLSEIIKKLSDNGWDFILSYNDCKEIRSLYNGFEIKQVNWKYGMSSNKESNEILIMNKYI